MSPSLHLRLVLAPLLVLLLFLGLTGLVLNHSFRQALEEGERDTLLARVYTLLAVADLGADGRLQLPEQLPEPRLSTPGSGLTAWVFDGDGQLLWQSQSTLGQALPASPVVGVGETRFHYLDSGQATHLFQLGFGIEWQDEQGRLWPFVLLVSESDSGYQAQVAAFGRTLWTGLAIVGLALLLIQSLVLAWGIRPLHQVASDLERIRSGERDALQGPYPKELRPFTSRINRFIAHERAARDRYRDRLAELAHSLKTPLAVMKTVLERGGAAGDQATVSEQLQRMDDIVVYQLGRAATVGRLPLSTAVAIRPLAERLNTTLGKVYRGQGIVCTLSIAEGLAFRGDRGDLMELLGNLLDNAYKWTAGQVRCGAHTQSAADRPGVTLWVEDDGPGIDAQNRVSVTQRGRRIDDNVDGQGIGLAVVQDIVSAYDGRLSLLDSELGGLRVEVFVPNHAKKPAVR